MKKTAVLITLFILPIVAYLFFASGVNNFGRLPVLTDTIDVKSLSANDIALENKITILGFLGSDIASRRGNMFNLNQKIYKRFHEFQDFQFVMVVSEGLQDQVDDLKKEIGHLGGTEKWNFAFMTENMITELFNSLKTDITLNENQSTPFVFIVDKEAKLRGRNKDEEDGVVFGFDTSSVAELNNKMVDDVKIILAEYRLALKKNNADR
ncbi:hypothetical protein D1013_03935 [Euzebyella marina]|uniref:Membrane or secreted protein n=1 Tax=Euzebyella marina TaxID=1761453 RepID=A0A3G2LBG2_9FLAO|nr:hypothetical protein [Euzebyella marina]AYN69594.1 hypothetical protein D1013_03935 [Euzebyella marina]